MGPAWSLVRLWRISVKQVLMGAGPILLVAQMPTTAAGNPDHPALDGRSECEPAGEERLLMRIGVHVGEVIVEGEDRHGDAVNTRLPANPRLKRGIESAPHHHAASGQERNRCTLRLR